MGILLELCRNCDECEVKHRLIEMEWYPGRGQWVCVECATVTAYRQWRQEPDAWDMER